MFLLAHEDCLDRQKQEITYKHVGGIDLLRLLGAKKENETSVNCATAEKTEKNKARNIQRAQNNRKLAQVLFADRWTEGSGIR